MKVELVRVDDAFHFVANGASEVAVHLDGAPDIGGHNAGARPMELLLMGLAGCSAIDVVLILQKQRQVIDDFRIVVEGERVEEPDTKRKPFKRIHLEFKLRGPNLDRHKIERAIQLSMEKYCSATAQFESSATLHHSLSINES
jgi:putative redox protein